MTVRDVLEKLLARNEEIRTATRHQDDLINRLLEAAGAAGADTQPAEEEPTQEDEVGVPATTITLTEYEQLYDDPRPQLRRLMDVTRRLRRRGVKLVDAADFANRYSTADLGNGHRLSGVVNDQVFYNKNHKRHYVSVAEDKARAAVRALEAMLELTPEKQVEEAERV